MNRQKKLIIACDGESASGKSTAAKLISKKYKLLLINSSKALFELVDMILGLLLLLNYDKIVWL